MALSVHYNSIKVVTLLALSAAVLLTLLGSLSYDLPRLDESDVSQLLSARSQQLRQQLRQQRLLTLTTLGPKATQSTTSASTTTTSTPPDPEHEAGARWADVQEERRRRIEQRCQGETATLQSALSGSTDSGYDFLDLALVDETHRLIYCAVPKVATTNWKRVFLVLNGKAKASGEDFDKFNPHDPANHRRLRDYPLEERVRMVGSFRKFLFVRHPFNRLDSAFYDRLHYDPLIVDNFKQLIGTQIIARYRPERFRTAKSLREGHDVRFDELAQYVTDETNPVRMANGHFAPISSLCFPCQVRYDWVGKYETLLDDARHILAQVNVSLPFIFPPSTNQGSKTSDRWAMDMRSLTPQLRQALLREYQRDFDLFDYDPDEWKLL